MSTWFRSMTIALAYGALVLVSKASASTPNIVVIFMDDLGYADIGSFGARGYGTPNLDRMASEGRRFTDFVVASAVCSASRSALMTGCIHERIGFRGALGPNSMMGIAASEMTFAELCKQKGYATAIFGKWHLGHHPKFLPTRHGFDQYVGLPYSNDMWPYHPEFVNLPADSPKRKNNYPPLPLVKNDRIIDSEVGPEDQKELTKLYTQEAVRFIHENRNKPFFLYVPHAMVHVPLFASADFDSKSGKGIFADVMQEVDWSVGQILKTLQAEGIDENTLVVFTSDNGPWLSYGDHAGSAGPLREGKGTAWEGGVRVPTLMRWPQRIPANTSCDLLASTIDLLPTVAAIIEAPLPKQKIDGRDIRSLMFGDAHAASPHASYPYYYADGELRAIRNERWKLVFEHESRTLDGKPGGKDGMPSAYVNKKVSKALYDLDHDVGEARNVLEDHPNIAKSLEEQAEQWRDELGDSLTKRKGKAIRPADRLQEGEPKLVP